MILSITNQYEFDKVSASPDNYTISCELNL